MIVLIYFRRFYDTSHGDSSHGTVGGVTAGARVFVRVNIISPSLFVIIFASSPERDVTFSRMFGTQQKANISLRLIFIFMKDTLSVIKPLSADLNAACIIL